MNDVTAHSLLLSKKPTRLSRATICMDESVLAVIDAAVPAKARSRFFALAGMMALTSSLVVKQDYAIAIRKLLKGKHRG